jgi:hypothetical protein
MQRPPRMERLTAMTGQFVRRLCSCWLIPAVCGAILLAACSGAASGTAPAERVPDSARVLMVSITYPPGSEPPGFKDAGPVSATVTALARVRQVAGLIDGMSLASPGQEEACVAFTGAVVNLAFRKSASGRMLATAQFMTRCGDLGLTVAGVQQYLNFTSDDVPQRVLQIIGIPVPADG